VSTYVISGAASGIGAATRTHLESEGHTVIGVDLAGVEVTADLSTAQGRARAVEEITALAPDGIAGLVPCAGIAGLTHTDAQLLISVNFFGAITLATGLKPLLEQTRGAVVLLSSNSVTCQPGWADTDKAGGIVEACLADDEAGARGLAAATEAVQVYPASKAALAYWARREAVKPEWAGRGIRINAVAPGLIATPMTDALREDPELGVFADAYPTALERPGEPTEIAALIGFLLSPAASLLVGSVVFADGGTDAMLHPVQPASS